MKIKGNCQSCGMPMSKDPQGGGTEASGQKSGKYCSYCYAQGKFTDPDLTVDQMIEKVKAEMKKMRIPGFLANIFAKGTRKLERWNLQR
jgi:hypothetical protein